ncbi:MAG: histidine phosphatase family protein [Fretibacterium sp.]|nr:histidine phosphatase family protein [Fretibacterium sp.]
MSKPTSEDRRRDFRKKVILARHGRTEWNDAGLFQGRTDIPLNEKGKDQAKRLARRLASWPVQAVYASPLTRALDTARAVAAPHALEPVVLKGLEEINFGIWEGLSVPYLAEQGALSDWEKDPLFNAPEDGESWEALSERVGQALETIQKDGFEHVVVVSHGGIMRVIYALLVGLSPHTVWRLRVHNCAMTGLEICEHETAIVFSNDDLHLRVSPEDASLPVW